MITYAIMILVYCGCAAYLYIGGKETLAIFSLILAAMFVILARIEALEERMKK